MSSVDAFPSPSHPHPKLGEPAWDLALMYPLQGDWSVENYLALDCGMMVEYSEGFVRVLPMPSLLHQWIARFLFLALERFVSERQLGEVFFAPLPVRLTPTKYREPDIVFVRPERIRTMKGQPDGADLVIEVVSDGKASHERDYVEKRAEYAAAGISEYWIVDPERRTITVLALAGGAYQGHGVFRNGDSASSSLLGEFSVRVDDVFAKCNETAQ
ncbi:MAG: Uma2 family endonuclease [Planctomycetota bacterium]